MQKKRTRQFKGRTGSAVALSAAIAAIIAGSAASSALAQDDELEEITVTGSRITRTSGFTAPVPITTVTPTELYNLQPGTTLSTQLDSLPQFFNTRTVQNASAGNGGSSIAGSPTAALNLRNLGGTRTLVLLDGRRVVPTDKRGTVNIDLFPSALMSSVDVVTGGASAAYGADAIGGVVNFVLDREFDGMRVNVGVGQHEGGIGRSEQFEIAAGTSFLDDRLHVIGSAQSNEIDEIAPDWTRYDSFKFIGHVGNPAWTPTSPAGVPRRLTVPYVHSTLTSPLGLIVSRGPNNANPFAPATPLHNMRFTEDGTGIVPFQLSNYACNAPFGCTQAAQSGGPEFAYRERGFDRVVGPAGNGVVTRSGLFGLKYDVSEDLEVYWQGIAGRTESIREKGMRFYPALAEGLDWAPTIFQDNALLPPQVRQTMVNNNIQSFRLSKVGSLTPWRDAGAKERSHDVYTTWNWSTGFDYTIPELDWNLQASYQKGQSHRNSQIYDMLRLDRLYLASDAVVHPTTGQIVCRVQVYWPSDQELAAAVAGRTSSRAVNPFIPPTTNGQPTVGNTQALPSPIGTDDTIKNCVPMKLWGGTGLTQEQTDYLHSYKAAKGYVDQDFAEILLNGELHEGWGAGPIDLALGLTWRDQQFIEGGYPEEIEILGPSINAPALGIQGMPVGAALSDPSLHFLSTVPYVGGQMDVWEWFGEANVPVFDRGEQNLVANLAYRRSDYDRSGTMDSWKVGLNLQVVEDLRLRLTRSADVREPSFFELFDLQGNAAFFNDPRLGGAFSISGQYETGMQNLRPETADTINVGAVWQPSFASWADGFQFSVDWYEVEIEDAVQTLGPQRIVDECEINRVQAMCSLIIRDPATQRVVNMYNPYVNLSTERVRGVDMEVVYQAEPDFFGNQLETFNLRWLTGLINERITIVPGGAIPQDSSDSLTTPDLTSVAIATYGLGPWSLQLQARYVDSVRFNITWVEGRDVDDNTVPSMTWFNARLGYAGEFSNGSNYSVGFNIQNLFDREPPVRPGFSDFGGGSQTLGPPHEFWGRRFNLNFNYSF